MRFFGKEIMSKITKQAKGRECQVRLVGVCNHNPETVVLAHYRKSGLCGMGIKPVDILGAWCCSSCHDVIDGRVKSEYSKDELELEHLRGVARTIDTLCKEGKITYD